MATNLKFLRGLQAALPTVGVDGTIYYTTDTSKLFMGVGEAIVPVNECIITVANLNELPASEHAGQMYYALAENVLAVYDGAKFTQVNPDRGATEFETVGEGNAITAVSYDAATRKLTLTKGETFATKAELEAISGTVEAAKPEVYKVTSESADITVLAEGITGKAGDVLIATNAMGVSSAYHYDAEDGWVACDGNVDASTVIINRDITMSGEYTQLGNYSKSSKTASKKLETSGKSVMELLVNMLEKKEQPTITANPSVSLTFSQAKAYEVGSTVNPSYTASLNAGTYKYGPATGVTATAWEVTDSNGAKKTTASGSFDSIVVDDDTNYTISAKADYTDGVVAVDSTGVASSPEVKIEAGTTPVKTSGALTGYRAYFYGIVKNTDEITSTMIRGLTNGGNYTEGTTLDININGATDAKRVIVAIPASSTRAGVTKVMKTDGLATEITNSYKKTEDAVSVADARGENNNPVLYDIWVYQPASIDPAEVHEITLG